MFNETFIQLLEQEVKMRSRTADAKAHAAVLQEIQRFVEALTAENIDSVCPDSNETYCGNGYLHLAIMADTDGAVAALIEKGADLHKMNRVSRTPLAWAIEMGNVSAVQKLLAKDPSRLVKNDSKGRCPLAHAVYRYQIESNTHRLGIFSALMALPIDINLIPEADREAFFVAVQTIGDALSTAQLDELVAAIPENMPADTLQSHILSRWLLPKLQVRNEHAGIWAAVKAVVLEPSNSFDYIAAALHDTAQMKEASDVRARHEILLALLSRSLVANTGMASTLVDSAESSLAYAKQEAQLYDIAYGLLQLAPLPRDIIAQVVQGKISVPLADRDFVLRRLLSNEMQWPRMRDSTSEAAPGQISQFLTGDRGEPSGAAPQLPLVQAIIDACVCQSADEIFARSEIAKTLFLDAEKYIDQAVSPATVGVELFGVRALTQLDPQNLRYLKNNILGSRFVDASAPHRMQDWLENAYNQALQNKLITLIRDEQAGALEALLAVCYTELNLGNIAAMLNATVILDHGPSRNAVFRALAQTRQNAQRQPSSILQTVVMNGLHESYITPLCENGADILLGNGTESGILETALIRATDSIQNPNAVAMAEALVSQVRAEPAVRLQLSPTTSQNTALMASLERAPFLATALGEPAGRSLIRQTVQTIHAQLVAANATRLAAVADAPQLRVTQPEQAARPWYARAASYVANKAVSAYRAVTGGLSNAWNWVRGRNTTQPVREEATVVQPTAVSVATTLPTAVRQLVNATVVAPVSLVLPADTVVPLEIRPQVTQLRVAPVQRSVSPVSLPVVLPTSLDTQRSIAPEARPAAVTGELPAIPVVQIAQERSRFDKVRDLFKRKPKVAANATATIGPLPEARAPVEEPRIALMNGDEEAVVAEEAVSIESKRPKHRRIIDPTAT